MEEKEIKKTEERTYVDPYDVLMPIAKPTDAFFGVGAWGGPEEVAERMETEKHFVEKAGESRQQILVSGKNEDPIVVTNCFVNIEDIDGVRFSKPLNFYDLLVFSAYCSIIDAGSNYCTPRQILKVMTGGRKSRSSALVGSIRDIECSLDKMRSTFVVMDWKEQARAWGENVDMEGVESFKIETYLIPADKETVQLSNGAKQTRYEAVEYPKLFRYVKAIRQFITLRKDVLDIDIQMTRRNMLIRGYLIRKIEQLRSISARTKRNSVSNNTVRFDTMIERCGIAANNRRAEKDVRDAAFKILDCFKVSGYIGDYEKVIGDKGKVVSVRIFV